MPKRVNPTQRRGEQLLIRVTTEELDWLESAAHLDRQTVNAYAYLLLQAHVASLASNEFVRADLQNRRAYEHRRAQTLQLPPAQPVAADDQRPVTEEHQPDTAM